MPINLIKGHVLVIGGEMSGASRMVALAARKLVVGFSTIGVLKEHLKYYGGSEVGTIIKIIDSNLLKKDVLVIGPGLGKAYDKKIIINFIEQFNGPIIFDADAISIFKNNKSFIYKLLMKKKNLVITPHEGEFKRIFKKNHNRKFLSA